MLYRNETLPRSAEAGSGDWVRPGVRFGWGDRCVRSQVNDVYAVRSVMCTQSGR
ncbi:MAG: hypothetical protein IPK82_03355 [Polyangiaceae bacterium]|nr:hypothetical protein [Polyangiaceae bacterium]